MYQTQYFSFILEISSFVAAGDIASRIPPLEHPGILTYPRLEDTQVLLSLLIIVAKILEHIPRLAVLRRLSIIQATHDGAPCLASR